MGERNIAAPQVVIKSRKDIYKVVVIGDGFVGKTSLIKKYVKHKIETDYLPTVGSSISKQPVSLKIGDDIKKLSLLIWDIAGQRKFHLLHKVYFKGAHGIILVFDLTKRESFENIKKWYASITSYGLSECPMILVGNKCDLKEQYAVETSEIDMTKMMLNISEYFETSALDGINVKEMFQTMAIALNEQYSS
jgi:small GTP-binding protein